MKKATKNSAKTIQLLFYCGMLALPVIQFCVFYVGVNFRTITLSFQNYSLSKNAYEFIWFDNYIKMIKDVFSEYKFRMAFLNSFKYYLANLVTSIPLGLLFSYYIFKKRFLSGFMKIMFFMPSIIGSMVLVILYQMVVNNIIPSVFGVQPLLTVISDKVWETLFVFNLWCGFGTSVLMYVGAMGNISEGTIEAAKIDGVNSFQEFIYIILPQMFSTISVFLVTGIAGIFTNQAGVFSFFGKAAEYEFYTVGYYMYVEIQQAGENYGAVASFGIMLTLIVVPATILLRRFFNKIDPMGEGAM